MAGRISRPGRLTNRRGEVSAASAYLMTVILVTGGALSFQRAFTRAYANLIIQQLSVWDDAQHVNRQPAWPSVSFR